MEIQTAVIRQPVIIVWDGYNGNAQRRKIFPEYKMKRNPASESIYESQKLMKKLLRLTKAISIEVPGYEGDDVLAAVVLKYKGKVPLLIESNDLDLRQLDVPMTRTEFPLEPKWITLYKTMVGDTSDNIKGCVGFGQTYWDRLTEDQKLLLEHIITDGWGYTDNEVREKVQSFFAPKALKWFCDSKNRELLKNYYKIVNFIPIPWAEVEKHILQGLDRPDLAEPIFKEFLL